MHPGGESKWPSGKKRAGETVHTLRSLSLYGGGEKRGKYPEKERAQKRP